MLTFDPAELLQEKIKADHPIAAWMAKSGKNATTLCQSARLDKSELSRIVHGKRSPSAHTTIRISEATGIPKWVLRPDIFEAPQ
jgi:transcriptional regulator with XRE-family HTH domain